jgi:hypothetical protein
LRLGQLLLRRGAVDAAQLAAALRQQVVYGGRLGTNLIELGYAGHDDIAHALAQLHGVPAALTKHFRRADPAAARLVPRSLASTNVALPIAFAMAGGRRRLVVCLRDPRDPEAVVDLEGAARLPIVATAAPELSIYTWLERIYGLDRPQRFAYARAGAASPLSVGSDSRESIAVAEESVDIDLDADEPVEAEMPAELSLVDLDDRDVARDLVAFATDAKHRASLLEQAGGVASGRPAPVRHPTPPPVEPAALDATAAAAAIERAGERAEVSEAVLSFMRGAFGAGLILTTRDGIALGNLGFGGNFDDDTVETIVVPLSVPTILREAHERRATYRGPTTSDHPVEDRFFKLFGLEQDPQDVVVEPVVLRDRVVCLYYAHGPGGAPLPDDRVAELSALARAAEATFVRLIRAAKRASTQS